MLGAGVLVQRGVRRISLPWGVGHTCVKETVNAQVQKQNGPLG